MCVKCFEAAFELFPGLSEQDTLMLLHGATCFPFGGPEDVRRQLHEMRDKGITTLDGALAYAEAETDRAMAETRAKEEGK